MVSLKSFSPENGPQPDEQIFRLIFENHAAIMLLIDPLSGEILDANQSAVNFYGYPKSKLCGMPIYDINILPRDQVAQDLQKVLHNEQNLFIFRHRLCSGEARIVEVYSSLIALREKNVLFSIIHDITSRRLAEETLRESEEEVRRLFDNAPLGIFQSTPEGKVISTNPAFVQMFGYDSSADVIANIKNVAVDLYADPNRSSDILRLMEESPQRKTFENVYRRKDGSTFMGTLHAIPIRDPDGHLLRTEGIIEDITERKLAHELIQESEERLAAVMEGSQLGYSDWNIQTGKILRNERWATMLGYTLKEMESSYQQWENLIHPDDRLAAMQAIQDHLDGKTPIHRDEYRLRARDGQYRWILDQGRIIEYDQQGRPLRMTATHTDITERKQAEAELRRAQEALEIAHRELQLSFAREQQLARIDELTEINNRRHLFELAEREFNIARRYRSVLSVLMFDLDDFKQINDIFGHAVGDQAIRRVTRTVCSELRSADIIGRYGGDEFVVLLPQTVGKEALTLAERIRLSVAALVMETDKGLLRLTISLGISQTVHGLSQTATLENLFLRADQAMYRAKLAGKNRAEVFDPDGDDLV